MEEKQTYIKRQIAIMVITFSCINKYLMQQQKLPGHYFKKKIWINEWQCCCFTAQPGLQLRTQKFSGLWDYEFMSSCSWVVSLHPYQQPLDDPRFQSSGRQSDWGTSATCQNNTSDLSAAVSPAFAQTVLSHCLCCHFSISLAFSSQIPKWINYQKAWIKDSFFLFLVNCPVLIKVEH